MSLLTRAPARALGVLALVAAGSLAAQAETVVSSKGEQHSSAFVTGYTYWSNSPPASAAIARHVVHTEAGGIGTWEDPVTVAVGIKGGRWHFAPGTRIYLEGLRKYAVVEDVCGSCGRGHGGRTWLDVYIGGAGTSARTANQCAHKVTGVQSIVLHPGPDYPVAAGELAEDCETF